MLQRGSCFQESLELVGKRWTGAILPSQRLKELEVDHLNQREVVPSTPVQVRYHLTTQGVELMDSLQPLVAWGHKWIPQPQI